MLPLWYLRRRPQYAPGHELRLLVGGDAFFSALLTAIAQARREVWLATYIFSTDDTARAVAVALRDAARRGVRVRVVVDGFGSMQAVPVLRRWWQGEPVAWAVYRPLDRWWTWLQPEHLRRMHHKLCAVDGEVGFVGGINIIDDRIDLHHGPQQEPRLDYAVQVRGPVVEPLMLSARAMWTRAAFGADWRDELTGLLQGRQGWRRVRRLLAQMRTPKPMSAEQQGSPAEVGAHSGAGADAQGHAVEAAFVLRDNLGQRRSIEALLLQACGQAHHHIDIACAYFYPGARLRRALREAAGRGVQVRLLLQGRVDYRLAGMAARVLYRELLNSGVRIFEYTPAFLHAKVVRVDDHWASLGSSNLDPLSMLLNFEANIAVRDGAFVRELAVSLESAMAVSREITAPPPLTRWGRLLRRHLVAAVARLYLRLAGETRRY